MPSIEASTSEMGEGVWQKSRLIMDKRGEVAGLMVERAAETQSRPPPTQRTPKSTSWRFGNLEKLKDRLENSKLPKRGQHERQHLVH